MSFSPLLKRKNIDIADHKSMAETLPMYIQKHTSSMLHGLIVQKTFTWRINSYRKVSRSLGDLGSMSAVSP